MTEKELLCIKELNKRNVKMVMEEFDFDRVLKVMKFLDWKWTDSTSGVTKIVTDIEHIKISANDLLTRLVTEHTDYDSPTSIATGGFIARYYPKNDNGLPSVELSFAVASTDSFYY